MMAAGSDDEPAVFNVRIEVFRDTQTLLLKKQDVTVARLSGVFKVLAIKFICRVTVCIYRVVGTFYHQSLDAGKYFISAPM